MGRESRAAHTDNAGILAVQMLAVNDAELTARLADFKAKMAEEVAQKDKKVQEEF